LVKRNHLGAVTVTEVLEIAVHTKLTSTVDMATRLLGLPACGPYYRIEELSKTVIRISISVLRVSKGKRKSDEEAAETKDGNLPFETSSSTAARHRTTAGDIGRQLATESGQRIQQLEFQLHSQHRRKPTDRSVASQ